MYQAQCLKQQITALELLVRPPSTAAASPASAVAGFAARAAIDAVIVDPSRARLAAVAVARPSHLPMAATKGRVSPAIK